MRKKPRLLEETEPPESFHLWPTWNSSSPSSQNLRGDPICAFPGVSWDFGGYSLFWDGLGSVSAFPNDSLHIKFGPEHDIFRIFWIFPWDGTSHGSGIGGDDGKSLEVFSPQHRFWGQNSFLCPPRGGSGSGGRDTDPAGREEVLGMTEGFGIIIST